MAMFSQTTIILGNGFDLDLGLNTSYKSFIDSKDFEFWMKEYIDTPDETNLFDYIFKQRLIDTWGNAFCLSTSNMSSIVLTRKPLSTTFTI